jgi:hypothetical protein
MWLRKTSLNKNIKLRQQFYPNPDYCTLRVTGPVTLDMILTLTSPEKKTQLINNLFSIKGIKRVFSEPYEVKVEKESDFNWQKILPEAEKIISKHLVTK